MSLRPPKPSLLAPGYRLDRYELLCPIAQGGMAQVWVARMSGKHGFEKLVAVKTILPQYALDDRFQQMFLDEARIASRIEHVNVAHILDLGEEHGVLYLVMEWVDGDALNKLHRVVEKKGLSLPPGVVARIVADASGGLHAAHELRDRDGALLGVVHRDVSPHNILVNGKGVAKVIDFGIAKARDRLSGETSTGFLKGKVQYMAPEQALGREVDRRADVWALGAILYHLYANKLPFDAPNQLATLHMLTMGKPPPPLPASVPEPLARVVFKAMANEPDGRYATAADMQRALEAAMSEAGCATSASDVADFAALHVSDRAEARKKAVDLALGAASERARVQRLLVPPSSESSSGLGDIAPKLDAMARRIEEVQAERAAAFPASGTMTAAETPRARQTTDPKQPISEESSATLGTAAFEAMGLEMPVPRSRSRVVGTVAAFVAGAALLFVVARPASPAATTMTSGVAPAGPMTPAAVLPVANLPPTPPSPLSRSIPPVPSAMPSISAAPAAPEASAPPKPHASASATPAAHVGWRASPPKPAVTTSPARPAVKGVDDGF